MGHTGLHLDTFTTPEQFAVILCEDMLLPAIHFAPLIVAAMNEQLEESRRTALEEHVYASRDTEHELDEAFWKRWRKRLRPEVEGDDDGINGALGESHVKEEPETAGDTDEAYDVDDTLPQMDCQHDELRVLIKVWCRRYYNAQTKRTDGKLSA
jgi:SNF5 / SMARCB1 / INI1